MCHNSHLFQHRPNLKKTRLFCQLLSNGVGVAVTGYFLVDDPFTRVLSQTAEHAIKQIHYYTIRHFSVNV